MCVCGCDRLGGLAILVQAGTATAMLSGNLYELGSNSVLLLLLRPCYYSSYVVVLFVLLLVFSVSIKWGLSENPCLRFIYTKTKYNIMCQKPCARKLRVSTAQGWRKPLIHELWLNASHVVNSENSKLRGESAQASRKRRASSAQARVAVVSLWLILAP